MMIYFLCLIFPSSAIYVENQHSQMCARAAMNNILQGTCVTSGQLFETCEQSAERIGADIHIFCNPGKGNFDRHTMEIMLERLNMNLIPDFPQNLIVEHPENGYILAHPRSYHWWSLRKIDGYWMVTNEKQVSDFRQNVQVLTDEQLGQYLSSNNLEVHAVTATTNWPTCPVQSIGIGNEKQSWMSLADLRGGESGGSGSGSSGSGLDLRGGESGGESGEEKNQEEVGSDLRGGESGGSGGRTNNQDKKRRTESFSTTFSWIPGVILAFLAFLN